MTIPHAGAPAYTLETPVARPGRTLAGAIAVFLGGYLLLGAFNGQLIVGMSSLLSGLTGRPAPYIPETGILFAVLQFLFALVVVVAGLVLAAGSLAGRLVGALLVTVGSIVTVLLAALRITGISPIPGGREGIPFQAVFANSWFAIVLLVGIAWLLTRRAKRGWLALLGTLVLIPIPISLAFAGADAAVTQLVMYLLCGLVGAGIILAGRPFRD